MKYNNSRRSSGFTMVELLIAVIIIGILVTIIVPVLTNRAADARLAAAKADMEAIANAQSQVALDTGYVVRLHVLNDSGAPTDNLGTGDINDVVDTIRDENLHANAPRPEFIFLDARTGEVLPTNPTNLFPRVQANPEQFGWRGPYVNFQRILDAPAATAPWSIGTPLDPWGNPYFLLVPGPDRIGGGASQGGVIDEDSTGDINSVFNYNGVLGLGTDQFDRLTLLSLGPNGQAGTPADPTVGTGDDLIRAF